MTVSANSVNIIPIMQLAIREEWFCESLFLIMINKVFLGILDFF
jgi:hypothetical protein